MSKSDMRWPDTSTLLSMHLRQTPLIASWLASGYIVARYYRQLVGTHGLAPQALDERENQKVSTFYDHLFQDVPLSGPLSVLDIGCGLGDLIVYLKQRNVVIDQYLGIDLLDVFIQEARHQHGKGYQFQRVNFISPAFMPRQRFAVVVNLGCMVSRVIAYESYVRYTCTKMMALATDAVLFNVITSAESSAGNYQRASQIGQITSLPRQRLIHILDDVVRGTGWTYSTHDTSIYADSTDTFVWMHPEAER